MNLKRTIGAILVIAGVILGVAKALGGEGQSGDWTIRRSDDPGKVEFSLMDSRRGITFTPVRIGRRVILQGWIFPRPGGRKFILRSRETRGNSNAKDFCRTVKARGCFTSWQTRSMGRR